MIIKFNHGMCQLKLFLLNFFLNCIFKFYKKANYEGYLHEK